MLRMEFQHGGGNDCEKRSCRGQPYSHVDGLSVDCRSRRLETACTKGIDNKRVEHGSGRRPCPWFVHQLGKLNLAASNPWVCHPRHNDERFLKKYLGLDIVLNGNRRQSSNPKFNAALSQCFTKRQCATWYNVEDSARMFPRQPMDYCHNDPF